MGVIFADTGSDLLFSALEVNSDGTVSMYEYIYINIHRIMFFPLYHLIKASLTFMKLYKSHQ